MPSFGVNCSTVAVWQLGYKAVLQVAGIDDPKLDSTTSHHSSSHSLPCRVVCHPGHPAPTIMGGPVLRLQCACFVYFYCRYPLVGSRFQLRLRPASEPSVSAVVSVTAITGLQIGATFGYGRNQKKWFRSVSIFDKISRRRLTEWRN